MKCKLSDIVDIIGGGTPKTSVSEYWDGDIPWLSVKDFNNDRRYVYTAEKHISELGLAESAARLLKEDDCIISARGTVGELAMIPYPMAFNQSCYGLRAKVGIVESKYLYYLVKDKVRELRHNTHGSVFDTITRNTFDGIEVELPPLETQRKIASVLSSLDDKIELNDRINANLEEQAKAIFKSWFVDFEPFGGKMPKDWKRVPFEAIANISSGKLPPMVSPELTKEARIPFVGSTSILGYTNAANRNEKILITGKVGTLGVVQRFNKPCWVSNNAFVITSPYHEYTYQILKRTDYMAMNRGSAQPFISYDDLNKKMVLLPDKQTLCRYEAVAGTFMKKHEDNIIEDEKLALLRDALLPRLLSGELDVSNMTL